MIVKNILTTILITIGINLIAILGMILYVMLRVAAQSAGTGGIAAVAGGVSSFWMSVVILAELLFMFGVCSWLQRRVINK